MNILKPILAMTITLVTTSIFAQSANPQTIISYTCSAINVPGAISAVPNNINFKGAIVGNYFDLNNLSHGYVRSSLGVVTTFDVPGAIQTIPAGINDLGVIAGSYLDNNNVSHGFVRAANGNITSFDVSSAGNSAGQGTFVFQSAGNNSGAVGNINDLGAITGMYVDSSNVYHGYVRAPNGEITTFDAPNAGTGSGQGTLPNSINQLGVIVGLMEDSNNIGHGFVRFQNGEISILEDPNAGSSAPPQGTNIHKINISQAIVGQYTDALNQSFGFLRSQNGAFTTIESPGSVPDTILHAAGAQSINDAGTIVGFYLDPNSLFFHGYVRTPNGVFTSIDASSASDGFGTATTDINLLGQVLAFTADFNFNFHPFVCNPVYAK